MKLHKSLSVGGTPLKLVSEDVRLALFSPGRAVFTVQADAPLSGVVQFALGYDPSALQRFFIGYVESCTPLDNQQQRVFCRELTATLNRRLALNLRHVTLNDTLAAISQDTGLTFVTPLEPYATAKAPAFYSWGSGYHCMDALAEVYTIPNMIWQQQGDGAVYVGSWTHSYWATRPVEIPTNLLNGFGVANRARLPMTPKLRPGVWLNQIHYVTQVCLAENHMNLTWSAAPWTKRLKR
ncbi:hypothetical protein ONV78_03135 [Hahella sp. CR1]|uniref:hypothetical protein n=1 Tax=Hahella sp. CR1 TaxID=2992807 RepID=UPI002442598F|nr:hypothetical protein [Hahella sp. CR1]MDG9666716.1 hypothetical protein [Hahella sp. CR1]